MNRTRRTVAVLAAVSLAGAAGCASSGGGSGGLVDERSAYGSPTAEMAVQRFLDGAKAEDYQAMGHQFGTRQGPAEERLGISEVEQRMIVLSRLLRHQDYALREAPMARTGEHRTRFMAEMTGTRSGRVDVPIVAVTTPDGRWFVEQVVVKPLTRDVTQ